jgi:hypothetical protein
LTGDEKAALVDAVERVRGPYLVRPFGIGGSSHCSRAGVTAEQLKTFAIIPYFQDRYGSVSFGEFAARIKDNPLPDEMGMSAEAATMLHHAGRGGILTGQPIAIDRPNSSRILIEGYKRSMVALWSNAPSISLFLITPSEKSP